VLSFNHQSSTQLPEAMNPNKTKSSYASIFQTVKQDVAPTVAMRQIGLFIDGVSRATLLSFAPIVMSHLLLKRDGRPSSWGTVSKYTAMLVATYFVGNAFGTFIGYHTGVGRRILSDVSAKYFSRTVGVILALHLFSLGSGSWAFPLPLCFIRFIMGALVGLINRTVTSRINIEFRANIPFGKQHPESGSPVMTSDPGRVKVWLCGFAVSILSGGLLYDSLCNSTLFIVLTGAKYAWTQIVATFFFLALVRAAEVILQFCCLRLFNNEEEKISENFGTLRQGEIENDDMLTLNIPQNITSNTTEAKLTDEMPLCAQSTNRSTLRLGSQSRRRIPSQNRVRLDSNKSNDLFFDCESHFGDSRIDGFEDEDTFSKRNTDISITGPIHKDRSTSIAKLVDRRCVFEDGAPAPVPAGECVSVPPRAYQEIFQSNSFTKWSETQRWRKEQNIWKVLDTPHLWFPKIKDAYSHRLHGYSKLGYPIVYEKPGKMELKNLFRNGLEVSDMIHHYMFFMEYISQVICKKPEIREVLDRRSEEQSVHNWGFVVVMDVSGVSISVFSGCVLKYLQQAENVNSSHYPLSTDRCFLVNSPFWISGAFGAIKNVLPSYVTTEVLSGSNQINILRKFINDDQIPKEFGGSSPFKLGEHPFEVELNELVEQLNSEADVENVNVPEQINDVNFPDETLQNENDSTFKQLRSDSDNVYQGCHYYDYVENVTFDSPPLNTEPTELIECRAGHKSRTISLQYNEGTPQQRTNLHFEEYNFVLASVMHILLCTILGSLETVVPLWLMSPHKLGGLGYEPPRVGISYFAASIVLMWLLRTKLYRIIFHVPEKSSLRGYRVGVGAQAFFLALLPFVTYFSNNDSILVMTITILLGAPIAIASMIAKKSSATLHLIATISYVDELSLRCDTRTCLGRLINKMVHLSEIGGLTYALGVGGEVMGAIFVAPIFAWSTNQGRPFPFDVSFSFYTGASLCAMLYITSFSLYLKVDGDGTGKYNTGPRNKQSLKCSRAFLGNFYGVLFGDLASLVDTTRGVQSIHTDEVYDYDAKII